MINQKDFQNLPRFSSLAKDTIYSIAQRAFKQKKTVGSTLVTEGFEARFCYFLLSGAVRVIRMNIEGRVQVLARFERGAPLNIFSLMRAEGVNLATIETITPVSLLTLSRSDFNHLVSNFPDFTSMLLQTMANRISTMTDLATGLSLYTVRARLAQFLLEIADKPQILDGWTQDEIAAHIGTVRDVVGRLLREFENKGLIKRDRQNINLLNRSGLLIEAGQPED